MLLTIYGTEWLFCADVPLTNYYISENWLFSTLYQDIVI